MSADQVTAVFDQVYGDVWSEYLLLDRGWVPAGLEDHPALDP